MKNYLFLLLFLIFSSFNLSSQDLRGKKVEVMAITSASAQEYFIETSCNEKEITIMYRLKDSISRNGLDLDSTYISLSKKMKEWTYFDPTDTYQKEVYRHFRSVIERYTVYSVDSIKFRYGKQPKYEKLLHTLFNSSKTELENKEKNKDRIVLDGTSMSFTFLMNEVEINKVQAQSLTVSSHPLLYNYVDSSLELYRQKKKNNFLSKARTSGY